MKTNFVIFIPSRIGSTRLRNKPLIDINGMTLIERVFKNSITISKNSFIATDSIEILNHAKTFTQNVIITSNSHISGTDRIYEAAKNLNVADETLIINLQGDEPFMPKNLVSQLIKDFNNNKCDVISACHSIKNPGDLENPNCVKVQCDNNNYAKSFQRKPSNKGIYDKHIGIYGYKMKTLKKLIKLTPTKNELMHKLEQLRFMDNSYTIYMTKYISEVPSGIDTQEDIDMAIKYLESNEN